MTGVDEIVRGMARVAIINRVEDLLKQLGELDGCAHAWHCERCGLDGHGMADLRAEWESDS